VGSNEDRRARMDRLRRWEADQRRARSTQHDQTEAAERRRRARRGIVLVRIGVVVMVLAVLLAAVHMFRHLGANPGALEDLTVGYPAAGGLFVIGLLLWGGNGARRKA